MPFFAIDCGKVGEIGLNQKERLEEIRKKHEQLQRQRAIRLHRGIVIVAAVIVIIIFVLLVKGCVTAISNDIARRNEEAARIAEEQAKQQQAEPSPTPQIHIDPNVISEDYYRNCAFVGNSFADDLFTYGLLDEADFFAKTGLSVEQALSEDSNGMTVIDGLYSNEKYTRIFLMFGENELGWPDPEMFATTYGKVIDQVKKYQPQSQIYLLSITPVTKKASDENVDNANNEKIREYNELIKQVATEKNAIYMDIYSAVADKDGNLPAGSASDGVHFGKDYYEKCLLYIQNNDATVKGE